MVIPNFIVIGAAKAGTSALYDLLDQHPQIYMSPEKEPMFFAFKDEKLDFRGPGDDRSANYYAVTDLEAYQSLFKGVSDEVAVGEASALYLYHPKAPERIFRYIPEVKLIAILRDPVLRAYSNFLHLIRDGREPVPDFIQAIQQEESRISNHWEWFWHYRKLGLYYEQLKRYFDIFNSGQIRVYLYEDFTGDSLKVLRDIFSFLAVDDTFVPDLSIKVNVSGIPRNRAWHTFLREPNPIKDILKPLLPVRLGRRLKTNLHNLNLDKPKVAPEIRQELIPLFREDILKLQDLTQRDLSKWLN
jgi:hypothetical protein